MKHIEFERLVDNFERGVAGPISAEVADHLVECVSCSAEYRRLANFFEYVATGIDEDVPQATTARILNIYQRRPAPKPEAVKKAAGLGFLVFDEWATALNERYSGIDSRQLLYRIDEFDIDLRIEFVAQYCRLTGQILPGIEGAMITLSSVNCSLSNPMNEFGEFEFESVEPGMYDLIIKSSERELTIKKVPLRQ